MHMLLCGFAIVSAALVTSNAMAQVGWGTADIPGEEGRTVGGCAGPTPGDEEGGEYACILVRCDEPGSLGLHFDVTGGGVFGHVQATVDGKSFPISADSSPAFRSASRATSIPPGLIEALKSGKELTIERRQGLGAEGQVHVPLINARPLLERLEQKCATMTAREAAGTNATQILVKQEIAGACDQKPGTIDPASVIERDLTGDGRADMIVHHHGIACEGGARSAFCGAQACSFRIYVRRDAVFDYHGEHLGVEWISVEGSGVPVIRTPEPGGKQLTLKWNGLAFAASSRRDTGAPPPSRRDADTRASQGAGLQGLPQEIREEVQRIRKECTTLYAAYAPSSEMQGLQFIKLEDRPAILVDNLGLCNDHVPGANCSNRGCDLSIWRQDPGGAWQKVFKEHLYGKTLNIDKTSGRLRSMSVGLQADHAWCKPKAGKSHRSSETCGLTVRYSGGQWSAERAR